MKAVSLQVVCVLLCLSRSCRGKKPEEALLGIQKTIQELMNLSKKAPRLPEPEYDKSTTPALPDTFPHRTLAEKVFFVPLKSPPLEKFVIDMAVELSYPKGDPKIRGLISSKVNAELTDLEDKECRARSKNHFEYTSPTFQLGIKSLPVGLQLFIPVHRVPDTEGENGD